MKKFSNYLCKVFAILMGILICITISGIIISYPKYGNYFSSTSQNGKELFWLFTSIAVGGVIITCTILGLFRLINKLSKKGLLIFTIALFVIYGISTVAITYLFPTIPMTDSFYVHDQAVGMAHGTKDIINGNSAYFRKYSNNNPLIILLYFIYKIACSLGITDLIQVGRLFNASCIMGSLVLFYFAIQKLSKRETTGAKFVLLNLLFVPMIFMTSWVYTATICLPFIGGIMLCGANLIKNQSKKSIIINSAIIGVLSIVGYNIRPVVLILSIAGFICLFLWTVKDKKRLMKSALMVGICAVFALGSFVTTKALNNHYYTGSNGNFPLTHWIAMGLTENGMYDPQLVKENMRLSNTDEMKANVNKHIKERLSNYDAGSFISHLYIKNGSIWAVGSLEYQSRLIGSAEKYTPLSKWLYGSKSDLMCLYTQMLWLSLHILTLIYIIRFIFNKESKYGLLQILTLLGGYGFYMIWEVKIAYAVPFVFFIIGMATLGGESIENAFAMSNAKVKNIGRISYSAVAIFSIVLMFIGAPFFTDNVMKVSDKKLVVKSTHNCSIKKIATRKRTVTQEFYTKEKFNRVYLNVACRSNLSTSNSKYKITLKNGKNKTIATKLVDSKDYTKRISDIKLKLPKKYTPSGEEKFKITVKGISGTKEAFNFGYSHGDDIDPIRGNLRTNGKLVKGDLRLTVSEIHKGSLLSPKRYCAFCVGIVLIEVITAFLYFGFSKKKQYID